MWCLAVMWTVAIWQIPVQMSYPYFHTERMVGAVTNEERPSAGHSKRHRLPLLARSTFWFVIIFGSPVVVGILACFLVPIAMRYKSARTIPETNAIMSCLGLAVQAYRQEYDQLPSATNHDLVYCP
jgi:hypothetical protein